jgi:Flp pilus assembly protein TadG
MVTLPTARKRQQRGVTLPLMVFAIVLILAMAALAIDVATLYLAKSEAQRAADAAALAAARGFIVASTSTAPGDVTAEAVATSVAQQQASAAVALNNIAGSPAQLVPPLASNPVLNFNNPSNPTVTVSVQQNGLPTFFSRIWSHAPNSVSATAIAEAYNPSGSSSNPSVNVQCVKPFIVPNKDPANPPAAGPRDPFLDANGAIVNPGRAFPNGSGIVGELMTFNLDCPACGPGSFHQPTAFPPSGSGPTFVPGKIDFMPAVLPVATSGTFCASCAPGNSGTQFENDISCCNTAALACNTSSGNPVTVDTTTNVGGSPGPLSNGLQCLIHKNPASGMDILDPQGFPNVSGSPFRFAAGANNPLLRPPNPVVRPGDLLATSDSVVTLMISDGFVPVTGVVNIVGYMQVFIVDEFPATSGPPATPQNFTGYILNVSGCGNAARPGTPITGGGASPVAVRLIHN